MQTTKKIKNRYKYNKPVFFNVFCCTSIPMLKEKLKKEPNNMDIIQRIEYLEKYYKLKPNIDAIKKRLPGHFNG